MSYLTVDELLAMHVLVTGRPQNAPHPPQRKYSVAGVGRDFGVMSSWMIPAMTIRDVGLDNNRILPSGSVVLVDVGPVGSERKNCFLERDYVCHIQFRIPGEKNRGSRGVGTRFVDRTLWLLFISARQFQTSGLPQ